MNERWTLTSAFNGRLQIPGRPEPLGFGESCPWIGPLNEKINGYIGLSQLKAVRSVESTLPKTTVPQAEPEASSPASGEPAIEPKPKKK